MSHPVSAGAGRDGKLRELAGKVLARIERGEISIGRVAEVTGLTIAEITELHSYGLAVPDPLASDTGQGNEADNSVVLAAEAYSLKVYESTRRKFDVSELIALKTWFYAGARWRSTRPRADVDGPSSKAFSAPLASSSETQGDDLKRCALCGWTLEKVASDGCVRGNCSMRPLPKRFYSPARAKAEYAPHLDNDPRCVPASSVPVRASGEPQISAIKSLLSELADGRPLCDPTMDDPPCASCEAIFQKFYELAAAASPSDDGARQPAPASDWLKVIHAIAIEAMTAQSDPDAEAIVYRRALIGICNMALKAQAAASDDGAAREPQDAEVRQIEQHLSAVKGSPDWADLAEILDWYKRDVALLLADLYVSRKHAADLQTELTLLERKVKPPVSDSLRDLIDHPVTQQEQK